MTVPARKGFLLLFALLLKTPAPKPVTEMLAFVVSKLDTHFATKGFPLLNPWLRYSVEVVTAVWQRYLMV